MNGTGKHVQGRKRSSEDGLATHKWFNVRRQNVRQSGITLIELALVLGVAGILIGGIWAAASGAYEVQRVNQTVDQIRQIAENIRGRYATASTIPQQDFTTFTQTVAAADLFPAETKLNPGVDPATCSVGTPCYFVHPWDSSGGGSTCGGGTYCVGSVANLLVAMQGNINSAFVILLRNLPQGTCIKLASRFIDIWDDIGISGIGFNNGDAAIPGTPLPGAPPTIAAINANCAGGNANSLYLALRQSP